MLVERSKLSVRHFLKWDRIYAGFTAQKMKFFIKEFFSNFTFTDEIRNGKLYSFCAVFFHIIPQRERRGTGRN